MAEHPIEVWYRLVKDRNPLGLDELLDADVVFLSPVVHTPQRGKKITAIYLSAAFQVFFNPTFRYVREIIGDADAMLEFELPQVSQVRTTRLPQVQDPATQGR